MGFFFVCDVKRVPSFVISYEPSAKNHLRSSVVSLNCASRGLSAKKYNNDYNDTSTEFLLYIRYITFSNIWDVGEKKGCKRKPIEIRDSAGNHTFLLIG